MERVRPPSSAADACMALAVAARRAPGGDPVDERIALDRAHQLIELAESTTTEKAAADMADARHRFRSRIDRDRSWRATGSGVRGRVIGVEGGWMRAVFWFGLVCVAGCGGRATTETGEGDSDTGVTAPVTGVLDPSNVDASLFELAEGPPLVADGVGSIQIDTSNCVFSDAAALVVESGGVELCVVVVPGLTVPAFSRLDLRGSRPLVILSTGDIHVEEYADISGSGRGQAGGAGAGDAFAGANAGATGLGGGGGGGGCGAGGAGGAAEGGAGGAAHAPIDMLEPLQAGSRGGAGPAGVGGGGGGGALQLSSRTSVRIDGGLYFEGAGGTAGATGGGGGGGSGGSVLLEAPVVAFGENGIIAVTGGGGGGAGTGAEDGAVPEGGAGTDGGDGGDGGLATLAGGAGAAGASGGGGGGGGAGCVVVRSSTGATFPALLEAMNGLGAGALHVGQIRVLP